MADTHTPAAVLRHLSALRNTHELSILKISEPILSSAPAPAPADPSASPSPAAGTNSDTAALRTSDVSNTSLDSPTPAGLEADLAHYRELFAKLRFSYVEQVTKEKFIRAIVGDPPQVVSPAENVELERENARAKALLKARKMEVGEMVAELEEKGRGLSRRYEEVRGETSALKELPGKISELEERAKALRAAQQLGEGEKPELHLPLVSTLGLVAEKKRERCEVVRRLEQLASQVPRKKKELEWLQAELGPLEARRQTSAAAAGEARRRKENALGGVEDDLEERGRWWRAADTALRGMLEMEG